MIFFLAGFETTAHSMGVLCYLLSKNPEVIFLVFRILRIFFGIQKGVLHQYLIGKILLNKKLLQAYERLEEEIDSIDAETFDHDTIAELPYLEGCIKEAMRSVCRIDIITAASSGNYWT